MSTLNIFDQLNKGFTLVDLTTAIDNLPPRPSRVMSMGLFSDVSLTNPSAMIEIRDHALNLVPTSDWRAPAPTGAPEKRKVKAIVIPHTAWADSVLAIDVMGIRKFGSENVYETVADRVLDKLQTARDCFDATEEYRELSALKGIVMDADGTTPLFDSFDFFGISHKSIQFKFSDPAEDLRKAVRSVKRYIEKNLFGESVTGYRVLVGSTFYDSLVSHPSIKEALLGWQAAQTLLRDSRASGFEIEGVVFEEYTGKVSNSAGTQTFSFLDDDKGVVIPLGTRNTFKRYLAPAARIDTVNTLGRPYYAWQEPRTDKTGIDIKVESNTLPICLRPQLLVALTSN
jgi:hypothetical protein